MKLLATLCMNVVLMGLPFSAAAWGQDEFDSVLKDDAFRATAKQGDFTRLKHGNVYYQYSPQGDGPLLVLVHGFSVPSYIWDATFQRAVQEQIPVLRMDLYGRGYSDNPVVPYNVELFAEQVVELLDHLEIKQPVSLMGLSMGGPVVSQIAANNPERIDQLIYLDPAGFTQQPGQSTEPQNAKVRDQEIRKFIAVDFPTRAEGQLGDFYQPDNFRYWAELYRPLLTHKGFARALLSTQKNARSMEKENLKIGRAAFPVHFIWGAQDNVCSLEKSKPQISAWIPRGQYHVIQDCGHLPNIEQAKQYQKILLHQILKQSKSD